jgi:hypothetical protein
MSASPFTRPSKIAMTMAYLKACQEARDRGEPVYLTTDPAWLLDVAIGRRAGWVEDPHSRGITIPVGGKLPKKATGDAQRHLYQIAYRVNDRVRVYRSELGEWGTYLDAKIPDRFVRRGEDD